MGQQLLSSRINSLSFVRRRVGKKAVGELRKTPGLQLQEDRVSEFFALGGAITARIDRKASGNCYHASLFS
jgi:hypothetical protein